MGLSDCPGVPPSEPPVTAGGFSFVLRARHDPPLAPDPANAFSWQNVPRQSALLWRVHTRDCQDCGHMGLGGEVAPIPPHGIL